MKKEELLKIVGTGTLSISVSTIAIKLVGIATLFVILNQLSVYQYGVVELVFSIFSTFSIFLLSGLTNVVVADMAIERGKGNLGRVHQLFLNYFRLQGMLSFLAWATFFFGAHLIGNFYASGIGYFLKIVSFSFLISPLRVMFMTVTSVYLKFFRQSLYSLFEELCKFALIAILLIWFERGIDGVLYASVGSQAIAAIVFLPFLWCLKRNFDDHFPLTKEPIWKLFSLHGKWGIFSSYINTLGLNARLWIIKVMLGTEAVGLYALAQGLLNHTLSLVPLNTVLNTVIPHYLTEREKFFRIILKGIKYQLFGFAGIGVVLFFFAPWLIMTFFPKYFEAIPLFNIMLISLIPSAFIVLFTIVFFSLRAQKELFYASIFKAALTIVLTPLFIAWFGMLGIAYAFVVGTLIFCMNRYFMLKRLLPGFSIQGRYFWAVDEYDRILIGKLRSRFARFLPVQSDPSDLI